MTADDRSAQWVTAERLCDCPARVGWFTPHDRYCRALIALYEERYGRHGYATGRPARMGRGLHILERRG